MEARDARQSQSGERSPEGCGACDGRGLNRLIARDWFSDPGGWKTRPCFPDFRERDLPLFYFDTSNGIMELDQEGTELADVESARKQAVRLVGEMLRYDGTAVWQGGGLVVQVSDQARAPLFTVRVTADNLFPAS